MNTSTTINALTYRRVLLAAILSSHRKPITTHRQCLGYIEVTKDLSPCQGAQANAYVKILAQGGALGRPGGRDARPKRAGGGGADWRAVF